MQARNCRLTSLIAIAGAVALLPIAASAASSLDDLPETGPEAIAYFEGNADVWLEGPVDYLILDDERKLFKGDGSVGCFFPSASSWGCRGVSCRLCGRSSRR